jgi:hypothetical protein
MSPLERYHRGVTSKALQTVYEPQQHVLRAVARKTRDTVKDMHRTVGNNKIFPLIHWNAYQTV